MVYISRFPDHIHEGRLIIPKPLGENWPSGSPSPAVVARGTDKRFPDAPRIYDLVSVFDGDVVDVGRIVADSSFHHYINRNLVSIKGRRPDGSTEPLSDLDQIAQYYANLALWLAPKWKRDRMVWGLFFWAARHPDVTEEKSNPPALIGRAALSALEREIGRSNLLRLLGPSEHDLARNEIAELTSRVFLNPQISPHTNVTNEMLLGGIIRKYHESFDDLDLPDPGWLKADPVSPRIVGHGISEAFRDSSDECVDLMSLHNSASVRLLKIPYTQAEIQVFREERIAMADEICEGQWNSKVNSKDDGFFNLETDGGGFHKVGDDRLDVTWTCTHGQKHKIEITESDTGVVYSGDITLDPSSKKEHKAHGKRKKPHDLHTDDDDPWDGVKTS